MRSTQCTSILPITQQSLGQRVVHQRCRKIAKPTKNCSFHEMLCFDHGLLGCVFHVSTVCTSPCHSSVAALLGEGVFPCVYHGCRWFLCGADFSGSNSVPSPCLGDGSLMSPITFELELRFLSRWVQESPRPRALPNQSSRRVSRPDLLALAPRPPAVMKPQIDANRGAAPTGEAVKPASKANGVARERSS